MRKAASMAFTLVATYSFHQLAWIQLKNFCS
jgi:hypothetical protein